MAKHWWAAAGTLLIVIATASCSDKASGRADKNDPCFGQTVACVLTQDSGIDGVPVPRSDLQIPSLNEPFEKPTPDFIELNTRFGALQEYIEFYSDFMTDNGWTADPTQSQHSEGSPEVGPIESTSWSRRGSPYEIIITVADGLRETDDAYISMSIGKMPPQFVAGTTAIVQHETGG